MQPLEIGVCSWSVDREDSIRAIQTAHRELGVRVVHLGLFGQSAFDRASAAAVRSAATECGVHLSGLFVGFDGEDFSSPARARATTGIGNDDWFDARASVLARAGEWAQQVGIDAITIHGGVLPSEDEGAKWVVAIERIRGLADELAEKDVSLLLETGSEPAERMARFLEALDRSGVGVNFDAGNFVTYASDDAVRAVTTLARWIRHVHLKDYCPPTEAGASWGSEVPLGSGEAQIPRVISKLRARGYAGPLVVEHSSSAGVASLRSDVDYLRSMFA